MSILDRKNAGYVMSDRLCFGNKASGFGVRVLEGLDFLSLLKDHQTFLNKNLFWYKYEDIFPHVAALWLTGFYDADFLVDLQKHYFSVYKKEIVTQPLLSGSEIMRILNIKPSRQVGEIKERLILAQLEGIVKTKEEAEKLVKNIKI